MQRVRGACAASVVAFVTLGAAVAWAAPLSESQWKKQANAVCKQTNKDLDQIGNEVFAGVGENQEPSAEQINAWVDEFVPIVEDAVASIDALNEPKALKSNLRKFKAEVKKTLTAIEADPQGIFAGSNDPFAKVDKYARKLGLKACAAG
jgi:hypothetical protein